MDATQSFKFVFADVKWLPKVAIGGAINFGYLLLYLGVSLAMSVVGLAAASTLVASLVAAPFLVLSLGYAIQITRNVIAGAPDSATLPEWTNFEQIARDGIQVWLVHFLLFLPLLLLNAVAGFLSTSGDATASAFALGLGCLSIPLGIGAGLLYPVAMGRFAATNDAAQALNVGALFAFFSRHTQQYLLLFLFEILAGLVAAAGLIACGVGFLFTSFYATIVIFHLTGAAYRGTLAPATAPNQFPRTPVSGPVADV